MDLVQFASGDRSDDNEYQLALVGTFGVGKTTIFKRLAKAGNPTAAAARRGSGDPMLCKLQYKIGAETITMIVRDTDGIDKFKTMSTSFYQGIDGAAFVFSREEKSSLRDIKKKWLLEARNAGPNSYMKFLVGNKDDLQEQNVFDLEIQSMVLEDFDGKYTVSAKQGPEQDGRVEEAFRAIAEKLHRQRHPPRPATSPRPNPVVEQQHNEGLPLLERNAGARCCSCCSCCPCCIIL